MPEGNSDTPVDRRQQLEEWRRAKAAQQKGSSASNNMKTPTVAGKSTTPSFFFAKSTDTSKSTQKTATAPPKSRPAEQRPILNSASASASSSRSATLPKKRSSPTRPRIIAAQKASMSKSSVKVHGAGGSTIRAGQQQMPSRKPSGPRAITGTPRKPMGEPSNNADKTNSDELRRRVLRASAKKMAQIRREGGDLKMKLGLLSVHARLQEAEREKKQAKNNTVRSLNEELKAAKTQSSPSTMQKKHNESVIKQDSPRRSSPNDKFKNKTKNQNKNRKSAAGSIGNTANPANDNSETTTGHSSLSTEAAPLEERVSRLAKEEFDRINTIITNMHLYQPVALRVNKSTVEPISNAKLLGWFRVNDARIAAIQGEMKLARAMLWILGARPVQINTNGSNDGHTSKYVWPYQQTDYWIARGKFEEACGEINEAFYVYEEAMSVLPHSTDDFKHAHQEFTDRMARSGFYMDKNKPRASYPASDTNKSISARQRRDQLRAQLELVFKMPLPSSPSIISPMPNGMLNRQYHPIRCHHLWKFAVYNRWRN
ncbi:hypothetical protein BDF22DRAFT_478410 [Syncephalis plumigaleata]|nr:hypothetical protein BDF22DRAFT_478410 [Syncephalis plumigaleata]